MICHGAPVLALYRHYVFESLSVELVLDLEA